jgi:ribonuclease D
MICVLQLTTYEMVYLVDCIALFDKIQEYLGPIFANCDVLKLVLDAGDVTELQRDFHIFSTAVIDIQELCAIINPNVYQVGLKTIVREYFDIEVDKTAQKADWRVRPLHRDLISYAPKDARYVLQLWYNLLPKLSCDTLGFERSKRSTLKLYKCPIITNPSVVFENDLKTLPQSLLAIFDNSDTRSLFCKVYIWRDDLCQILDNSLNNFIPKAKLGLIVRAKTKSMESLAILFPESSHWPESLQQNLLQVIKYHAEPKKMEITEEVIPEVVGNIGESRDNMDISPENIQVALLNDFVPNPNVINHNSLITIRTGKNRSNYVRRKNCKNNRKLRNEQHVAEGLEPIHYYINRGIKRRLRPKKR